MRQEIRFSTAPDGVQLAYATSGVGPPLVKVANWLSHLEFDWQSPVWRHWLTGLSRHNTLVRYDERGCGLSDWEAANLSLDAWVADLETVVETAGLRRFPLFGMSHGATVAIAYAARHPEQVSKLILYGGYVRGRFKRTLTHAERDEAEALLKLISFGWGQENSAFRQVYTTLFIPEGTDLQMRWLNDLQRITTSPKHAARIIEAYFSVDVQDLAPRLRVPTLILHGQADAVVPFDEGRHLATLIPNAHFVPLDSKNHVLLETEPAWERFLHEVHTFLDVSPSAEPFPELTAREHDVLELIAQGLSNDVIAAKLFRSPATVRNHITSVFAKLNVESRAQAIVKAREAGLGRSEGHAREAD